MGAVVTAKGGYDLGYAWKGQSGAEPEKSADGYYMNAAQAGGAPGRWFGTGLRRLAWLRARRCQRKRIKAPTTPCISRSTRVTGEKLGRPPKERVLD